MPNIITHALFAEDMLERLPETVQEWLKPRAHLFGVGSNGPDFLFFHGRSKLNPIKSTQLQSFGNQLHAGHVNAFYQSAMESIRKEKDAMIKADMTAYVCGHLCHWALDSTAHPYVFYRTGTCKGKDAWYHHRMESILDSIMLKIKHGETIESFYTPDVAKCTLEEARAVSRVYIPAICDIFNVKIKPHLILDSLNDWHSIQELEYDPSGKKIEFLQNLEKVSNQKNAYSGFIVPNAPEDDYDVCNLLHKEWLHPSTDVVSTDSFLDLYDQALAKADKVIALFLDALYRPMHEKKFFEFVADDNYNLGIHEDLPMKNFDICTFDF